MSEADHSPKQDTTHTEPDSVAAKIEENALPATTSAAQTPATTTTTATPTSTAQATTSVVPSDTGVYLAELIAERERLAPLQTYLPHTLRLLSSEILRAEGKPQAAAPTPAATTTTTSSSAYSGLVPMGSIKTETSMLDGKLIRKVFVPVELKPSFNFVGRLLGHRGATLQSIEQQSGVKLLIRGKGSTRGDKAPIPCKFGDRCARRDSCVYKHPDEEETRNPNNENEPLHVLMIATPDHLGEHGLKIAQALVEPLLVPDDRAPSHSFPPSRSHHHHSSPHDPPPPPTATAPTVNGFPTTTASMDPTAAYHAMYAAYFASMQQHQQQHQQHAFASAAGGGAPAPAEAGVYMYQAIPGAQASAHTSRYQPYSSPY